MLGEAKATQRSFPRGGNVQGNAHVRLLKEEEGHAPRSPAMASTLGRILVGSR